MAKAIIPQEHTLVAAQRRIEELERRGSASSSGFLGAIFGNGQQPHAAPFQISIGLGSSRAAQAFLRALHKLP